MKQTNTTRQLTPWQRYITKQNGTEPPFQNEYWNHHEPGLYVDIVTGIPLFSSLDKFDSSCGWPSFARPVDNNEIINQTDASHGMIRTEVRAKTSNHHLGHLFDDGPKALGGLRYCINSASLRFVAKDELEKEGYGQYLKLFADK